MGHRWSGFGPLVLHGCACDCENDARSASGRLAHRLARRDRPLGARPGEVRHQARPPGTGLGCRGLDDKSRRGYGSQAEGADRADAPRRASTIPHHHAQRGHQAHRCAHRREHLTSGYLRRSLTAARLTGGHQDLLAVRRARQNGCHPAQRRHLTALPSLPGAVRPACPTEAVAGGNQVGAGSACRLLATPRRGAGGAGRRRLAQAASGRRPLDEGGRRRRAQAASGPAPRHWRLP